MSVVALAGGGHCAGGEQRSLSEGPVAWAGVPVRTVTVSRAPGRLPFVRLARVDRNGVAVVFSVLGARLDSACRPTWLHVELPVRPNMTTGWVRAGDLRLSHVRTRILVDLSSRRLRLYRNGRLVIQSTVAVGAPGTPTPTGRYYVNQRLVPPNPNGAYGPAALGISAFSTVLTSWAEGGPIGIHGTNESWSIGRFASHGCIRLPNDVDRRVFAQTPIGTPVIIIR
jgi:L,D-transpeptidase catalytic domain